MCSLEIKKLYVDNYQYISYQQFNPENFLNFSILYLNGYNSDMFGLKVQAVKNYCLENNIGFTCFEYLGTGSSSGNFDDFILSQWLNNVYLAIEKLISKPMIIVGSSMGAWLMFHAALRYSDKIKGLIGIASAPDFTIDLIWKKLNILEKIKFTLKGHGHYYSKNNDNIKFFLTKSFLQDSYNLKLLQSKIKINCPVRLIHGFNDQTVPYHVSLKLLNQITSNNINLEIVKNGDHRLSEPQDIKLIISKIEELIKLC